LLIFGGFPPVAAFGFYSFALLLIIWNVYDFVSSKQRQTQGNDIIKKLVLMKTALPLLAVGISFVMSAITLIPFRDGMAGINLVSRTGGTPFSITDLRLFFLYENPPQVERTAYIGVLVLIFSLVGIISAFRTHDDKLRKFIFINVVLVIITILIAFGLLPHGFIRAIPVFNSNPWGRLIVVTLLALSALSAVGLDFIAARLQKLSAGYSGLTTLTAGRIINVVLIVVIAVQFHSQKKLFNNFNAVVPSAWFYPLTPSIKYVKEHLQPLQSVLADASSYWFAGTLGAYGIPEWLAHSFRTDREKEVLSELAYNRSKSPNTIVIDGKSIHFDSPLMEKLAIKYLLVNKEVGNARLLELPELSHEPAPPLPRNSWKQHIYIPKDIDAGAIGFSFMTYSEQYAPSNVRLALYRDNTGKPLVETALNKNEITEKEWAFFPFPDKTVLSKGGYYVEVSLPGYNGPKSLSAWSTKNNGNTDSFLEVNGTKTDLSLLWKIGYFEDVDPKKWNTVSLEKDIVIYENKTVTNSAYFVRNLDASNDQLDFSGLNVKQPSVDKIDIDNSQRDAGWIVLPMRLHPDWKAYVDDRPVKYDAYLDVLPAIPVKGPAHVIFRYEPKSFKRGLLVSLGGVCMFLVLSAYCYREPKQGSEPQ
jgi:fumarate reductase subunit D